MELKFLPSLLGAESLWLAMPIAEVLTALYDCGYQDAAEKLPQLRDFLKGELAHDDHL